MQFLETVSTEGVDLGSYTYSFVTVGEGVNKYLALDTTVEVNWSSPPEGYHPVWSYDTESVIWSAIYYAETGEVYSGITNEEIEFLTEITPWDRVNNRPVSFPNFPTPPNGNSSSTGLINVGYRTYSVVLIGYPIIRLGINNPNKPSYYNLVRGYQLDSRNISKTINIIPSITEEITLSYYRENTLESIPELLSIDWHSFKLSLVKNVPIKINISNIVLGTLSTSSPSVENKILSLSLANYFYPSKYLFESNLDELFDYWKTLYEQLNNINLVANNGIFSENRIIHKLAANNDIWTNNILGSNLDINFDINHPMFLLNHTRSYNWHINPQIDNKGIGNIVMDSPRTIEIHAALDAGKWGVNPDDPELPRLINLGWFIEKIAWFFGIRPKPDGKIDTVKDKASIRQVIDKNKVLDPEKIGVNSFGEDGMVLTRINNRFKNKDIVSDQCVIVKDFIQIVQEYFEQTNLALGIQESSAIEIKRDKTTARFNNQLEILVELVNLMSSGNEMIRANLVSSLVTQSQSNEIIAGLGLPSVTKTIPLKMDDKIYHLPYKGIAAHRSISQEIATCTYNVGLVTGQLL